MITRVGWVLCFICFVSTEQGFTQLANEIINEMEVHRIEQTLAADAMEGREIFSAGIEKAAQFIADEFRAAGLQPVDSNYFQVFEAPHNKKDMGAAQMLKNVVGILPGRSRPGEIVIFSAHYDHLGIKKATAQGDSIFNGANDDAAGTTAVIMLAKHFAATQNNERTLVFAAFTAEESGGWGSQHFSKQLDPDSIVAMFNIEMIGTESKWGTNSAFITGFEKSDMGAIMQNNLSGSGFEFYPDPYPDLRLFYRSDNATLARLGVPAHTISTSKMDKEKFYHTADDEIETLDMKNMTRIIQAIALSSQTIVAGTDTPARIVN